MFTGIIIVICSVIIFLLTLTPLENYFGKETLGTTTAFLSIIFGPIIIITTLWDLPTILEDPYIATFTQEGDLEFHERGIWNPPWSDREIVEVPPGCHSDLGRYAVNSRTVFKAGDNFYVASFAAKTCIGDLKTFYKDKDSRKNGGYKIARFNNKVISSLYNTHLSYSKDILEILSYEVELSGFSSYLLEKKAEEISLFIEKRVNTPEIQKDGLIVKIATYIYLIR